MRACGLGEGIGRSRTARVAMAHQLKRVSSLAYVPQRLASRRVYML